MRFFVYSRHAIEMVRPHEVSHAVISITSSVHDVARLPLNDLCRGVLRLAFVDAVAPTDSYAESVLFSADQAAQIWRFIHAHRDVERLVVHCDAGVSRSPAVAAAIAKVLTGDDSEFFGGRYSPNERVYRMLLASVSRVRSVTR